jgi:CBS domain-containing protein
VQSIPATGKEYRAAERDHRLLGIFTGRDAVHRVLAEGKSAASMKLAEVMTPDLDTMPPGRTAIEALRLMEDGALSPCADH